MKKNLLLILLFCSKLTFSQLVVTPNPFGVNSGTITVTYGASGDYSLFNPNSDPNLYLYTGFETDGVASTWDYHDTWSDINTMVPLTWSSSANAYVATFNIGTRSYTQDSSGTLMTIPNGLMINNWYFLIRNAAGTSQSADLIGTNYGFVPSTLSNSKFNSDNQTYIIDNVLYTNFTGKIEIEIISILGQKINSIQTENINSNFGIPLNINQKGIYFAVIKNNNLSRVIKFNL